MRVNDLGAPIVETPGDEERLAAFTDRLAENLYGRLPRFVRTFLSKDALKGLLAAAASSVANRS